MPRLLLTAIILSIFLVTGAGNASGESAISVELSLLEKLPGSPPADVAVDTIVVPNEVMVTASIGNVVFDIAVNSRSEADVDLRIELITSGPGSTRYFNDYKVPYGLPVILDSVIVRGNSVYRARVKPIDVVEFENDCDFSISGDEDYMVDPAPHFEIHFVTGTLGDYHWNAIRDFLELETKYLKNFVNLGFTQPISLYLMPCRDLAFHPDKTYEFTVDPVRSNVMIDYGDRDDVVEPLPFNMLRFYRMWGYSPRILVEGVAAFADFNDFYVKEAMQEDPLPDIMEFFVSKDFETSDNRQLLRRISGSFCKYLVNRFGEARFKSFYEKATDMSAAAAMEDAFGVPADSLTREWRTFVDTLNIEPGWFNYHAQRVSHMRYYEEATELLEIMYRLTGGNYDQMGELGNYYYMLGQYDKAERMFGKRVLSENVQPNDLVTYANMLLINGTLDGAEEYYQKALDLDSNLILPYYKIGRIQQFLGNTETALGHYHVVNSRASDDSQIIDAQLAIGRCLEELGDPDSARVYFVSALNGAKHLLVSTVLQPLALTQAGEAFVALGEPDVAIEHLSQALYIEERSFYKGRMALALGKAYDLKGERDTALNYYEMVKQAPGGFLFRADAQSGISQPYDPNR